MILHNSGFSFGILVIGYCNLFGICDLDFGIFLTFRSSDAVIINFLISHKNWII
jgi:hypothetical protein